MALEEPRENDILFTDRGITFAIDRDLWDEAGLCALGRGCVRLDGAVCAWTGLVS